MRRIAAAALLLILTLATPAGAQTTDNEIQILNLVSDEGGRVTLELAIPATIGRLEPVVSNFALTENGDRVDIEVEPITSLVDVVVVIDTSGSMQGRALDAARAAAAEFVEQLPGDARVGVVSFGTTAEVEASPDFNRDPALESLATLRAGGETSLWDGLVLATDLARGVGADRPYVVVLSDGDDTVSSVSQREAISRLREAGAGLYAIAIESPDADGASLNETVTAVGGQFFATDDIDDLAELYVDIAARLSSRYQLSYISATELQRSIVVSVAADGAIATADTVIEGSTASGAAATPRPAPVLNIGDSDQLGAVAAPDPGLLGGSTSRLVGLGALFGAFTILGLLMLVPATQVRLDRAAGADRVAGLNSRVTAATDRFVTERDNEGELDGALDAAGINLRPGEFVLLSLVGIVTVSLASSALAGLLVGGGVALMSTIGLYLYLTTRMNRRRSLFADQLTDTLGIISGSLRAGRGLPQAVELVAEEAPSPTAEQFRRIVFETRVGRDVTTAMLATAERMKSEDLEWVTRAVDVNRELGGDLTEVLDNVADTIRDRRRIARQVRALSAEGRASGWVMLALPILMFLFLLWRTPESAGLLVNNLLGQLMLGVAAAGMVLGYIWIRKLVNLKY